MEKSIGHCITTAICLVLLATPPTQAADFRSGIDVLWMSGQHPLILPLTNALFAPGLWPLDKIGVKPSGYVLLAVAMFSWWFWLTAARTAYCILGRIFGFYCISDFGGYWLRLTSIGLVWRFLYIHIWEPLSWWCRQFRGGRKSSSEWMPLTGVMARVFTAGDSLPVGRLVWKGIKLFQTIGYSGKLHLNLIGPSGSSKTVTLITWLGTLHRKASAFVIDCDAQMINAMGDWLVKQGHRVICLDPNHLANFLRGGWNALTEFTAAELRHGRAAVVNFAKVLGDALIRQENQHQPVFDNGARDFMVGLCLFVWLLAPEEKKNLVYVRHLLCCGLPPRHAGEDPFDNLLFEMGEMEHYNDGCDGKIGAVIARAAATMRSGQSGTGENPFRGSAMRQTSWLDIPRLAALSERSDFICEDLKKSNVCVFVVAPLTDIQTQYSGWIRALTVMTAYAFQNIPGSLKTPALMLIDEAPSLGRLSLLEVGSPGFRKYGIRLVVCAQDIPAIRAQTAYPDTYTSFISNAGVTLWLGTTDPDTLRYVSDSLGRHTRREKVEGAHWLMRALGLSKIPPRFQNFERQLLDPQQVRDFLDVDRGMLIATGKKRPYMAAIDPYWKALPVWRYNPDKNYKESLARQLTRSIHTSLHTHNPHEIARPRRQAERVKA